MTDSAIALSRATETACAAIAKLQRDCDRYRTALQLIASVDTRKADMPFFVLCRVVNAAKAVLEESST